MRHSIGSILWLSTTATDPILLVVLAVLAGIVIGAVGGWLASRRRTTRERSAAAPAACAGSARGARALDAGNTPARSATRRGRHGKNSRSVLAEQLLAMHGMRHSASIVRTRE